MNGIKFSIMIIFLLGFLDSGCSKGVKMEETVRLADLILINGKIYTVNSAQPWAEAVAIKCDRIIAVGSNKEVLKHAASASLSTRIIDLAGSFVLPGFIDSHTHFIAGGHALLSVKLRDVFSKEEFISRIASQAKAISKSEWILNGDWDHQQFSPPELPRKEWIDTVTPENSVCVNRHDSHMVLANSLALKIAGITAATSAPPGGEIVKDPVTGEPTGILKDAAMDLVYSHIPEPSFQENLRAAETALKHAAENGVTSIHDMADASSFEVYQELQRLGKLTARLTVYIPITEVETLARLKLKSPFGNNRLKIGGLKGFVDGSLGSSTALFFEPYTDDPKAFGLLHAQMFPEGIMEKRIMRADRAGLQVAVHAIGDRANAMILDIFEKLIQQNGPRDRRWRIEHAQHLRPEDMERMARLGIIGSVQPFHAIDDGRWAEKKIGGDRCKTTHVFRSLLDRGVRLAFGSDWTVAPLNPISGIYAAVTRQTTDGKNPDGWFPEQKISLEEAIRGYTLNAAFTEFSEHLKGTIESGKLADLVVLDGNLFEISSEKIQGINVKISILDGKVVF
ncbi:MAG: amidohydrolase [Candidatus Aminicenantales bacterium]